jgi:hypothetical protein
MRGGDEDVLKKTGLGWRDVGKPTTHGRTYKGRGGGVERMTSQETFRNDDVVSWCS